MTMLEGLDYTVITGESGSFFEVYCIS